MPGRRDDRERTYEDRVMRRIDRELQLRGWSMAELARRVSDAGSPMDTTGVKRVLGRAGGKPRRITLDECASFAEVFGIPLEEMFTDPTEIVTPAKARQVQNAQNELLEAFQRYRDVVQPVLDDLGAKDAKRLVHNADGVIRGIVARVWDEQIVADPGFLRSRELQRQGKLGRRVDADEWYAMLDVTPEQRAEHEQRMADLLGPGGLGWVSTPSGGWTEREKALEDLSRWNLTLDEDDRVVPVTKEA